MQDYDIEPSIEDYYHDWMEIMAYADAGFERSANADQYPYATVDIQPLVVPTRCSHHLWMVTLEAPLTPAVSEIESLSTNSTLNAPTGFSIEYSMTRDYGPQLNETALYMTAVTALEDLCFRDQNEPIPGYPDAPFRSPTTWSLPQSDLYLEISSQKVSYAIWGLQLTTGDVRKAGLWPVIARFFWQREFAGRLDFANKKHPLPPMDALDPVAGKLSNQSATSAAILPWNNTVLNSSLATGLVDGARLTVEPTYNGAPLSPRAVFGTAIDVMVTGADFGPDVFCEGLRRPGLEIVGAKDADGAPLLKYKSLIRAMSILMEWMVRMGRFGEVDVDVLRDKVMIGIVRIRKRVRLDSTS